jgi:outer membrane protein assembly factor BamB
LGRMNFPFFRKAMVVARKIMIFVFMGLEILTACGSVSTLATPMSQHNHVINAPLLVGSTRGDWPIFAYDPGHTGYVDQTVNPHAINGKLLWTQHLSPIFSSPVAGLRMLYISSANGYLYALQQSSGSIVWRVQLNDLLTDGTPVLEGKVLFVSVHSTALEALNAHTGEIYWMSEMDEKIQAPPLIVGRSVLVATRTTLWELDATTGRVVWKFRRGEAGWPTVGSPAVSGNVVYIGLGTSTQLWALDLTNGHVLWSFNTGDRIISEALVKAGIVYVGTWRGNIFALDHANGTKLWVYALNANHSQSIVDGVAGSMAMANGRLYVGDYRGVISCIDALHGSLIWRYATGAPILATPIVTAGHIYFGSGDGNFYALDSQTGRPTWHYFTGEIRASASLADGHLYVGSLSGDVYAFA